VVDECRLTNTNVHVDLPTRGAFNEPHAPAVSMVFPGGVSRMELPSMGQSVQEVALVPTELRQSAKFFD